MLYLQQTEISLKLNTKILQTKTEYNELKQYRNIQNTHKNNKYILKWLKLKLKWNTKYDENIIEHITWV